MKFIGILFVLLASTLGYCRSDNWSKEWNRRHPTWLGIHVIVTTSTGLKELQSQLPALAKSGVNSLVLEVDFGFQFKSRPELASPTGISYDDARSFSDSCRENDIRIIPQINCLGHQSWQKVTGTLLIKHPELDETPGQYPDNEGIYCRSWCPNHPDLASVIFPVIDELTDAFRADAFHVGMDEVFIIASEFCPRCKGQDPAKVFAKSVNDFHKHIVEKRKLEMFMWGDRLLDGKVTGYGSWEASENGTQTAIDLIPKDIVICDWHYEHRSSYPSLDIFEGKGFRVWPSSWKDPDAADLFALKGSIRKGQTVGHLVTTWYAVGMSELPTWEPLVKAFSRWKAK